MNRNLKSLGNSFLIILLYYLALKGLVKAFWNTDNEYQFKGRVKFLGFLLIISTAVIVILPYHLFNIEVVEVIYQLFIICHLLLLFFGISIYVLTK